MGMLLRLYTVDIEKIEMDAFARLCTVNEQEFGHAGDEGMYDITYFDHDIYLFAGNTVEHYENGFCSEIIHPLVA